MGAADVENPQKVCSRNMILVHYGKIRKIDVLVLFFDGQSATVNLTATDTRPMFAKNGKAHNARCSSAVDFNLQPTEKYPLKGILCPNKRLLAPIPVWSANFRPIYIELI